ncbi:MAG: hypothetical protein JSV09_13285 [Thermoplasmata archaeon]|nr:MAG: hypothetical protein JSV09_13285 [Thermoplasmata archaeon]
MPHRPLHQEDEGIGGFFEDIPTLIIVILGFGIFLLSIVNAFVGYQAQQDNFRMHRECVEFTEALMAYEELTYESTKGIIDGDKFLIISEDDLKQDFNPASLGFDYRIIIKDVSDYENSNTYIKSFQTSSPPARLSKYSVTSSIVIRVNGNYHGAQLIVTIW